MHRSLVVPLVGVALVASLGGCADSGDGGILVLKNVRADDECSTTGSEMQFGISAGNLDLLSSSGYLFIAQMRSRITALTGQEDQRTILVTGANVDIELPNTSLFNAGELEQLRAANLLRFKTLFSAAIRPNGGITDAGFELIPGELVERIAAKVPVDSLARVQLVATFTIVGDMSGAEITSQPFSYPVALGRNLAVNVAGACPLPNDFGTPRTGYACNPAQDGVVDCCENANGSLRCPATVSTM